MKLIIAFVIALLGHTMASVLTVGSSCDAYTPCPAPLSCVGNPTNLHCFEKKRLGMKCGQDPFWVCEDGLACDDDVCKTVVDTAGRCGTPDTVCAEGLSCVGNPDNLRCFMKKSADMRCGQDPFWVCADGLTCDYGICH